jgi:D-alanyl-D-alanine carboxypeptidase/D-alanyl-D-alanine-endopeptidase (penicillin-binding protein 4)
MRRLLALASLLAMLPAAPAAAGISDTALRSHLARQMNAAGAGSGALVVDLANGRTLFERRGDTYRIPASNEKLYTTAAAMVRFGPAGRLLTRVYGDGALADGGVYRGNLFLRGGGDPTFGSASFNRRAYGTGASVSQLARELAARGIERVQGNVYGDESYFDRLRGGPDSGYRFSFWIGAPLSGLSFNRGLGNTRGTSRQRRPAVFAAEQLRRALRAEGVTVTGGSDERLTPSGAALLATVQSPPIATLSRLTNVPSDNFMAEMLLKAIGARFGPRGSTSGGAAAARAALLSGPGIAPRIADGSGLSRSNRTTPRQIVRLLDHMDRTQSLAVPFRGSLAVACRSGTLAGRMCGTAASGRCRGKTGTLSGVSALSGYCDLRDRVIAFSFLMNRVNVSGARRLQNRMAAAIASYTPAPEPASPASRAGSPGPPRR